MFSFSRKSESWKIYFDEGRVHGAAMRYEEAVASFRQAIQLAPGEVYPHYELGYTLFLLERYEEALKEFQRTNELQCGFFLVQTEIYMCELVLSDTITPQVVTLLRLLQHMTDSGAAQSEQAASISRKVIELAPECALGYFYLGKALLGSEPQIAEECLQKCMELHPDDTTTIDAKGHLGLLSRQAGQEAEARHIWEGIVADYPNNPHISLIQTMVR